MRAVVVASLFVAACVFQTWAAGLPPPAAVERAEEVKPPTPEGWDLFESPEGRFSILLPTHRRTAEAEDDGIVVHIVQARAQDACEYAVLWSDTADIGRADALSALLASIAEGRGVSAEQGDMLAGQDRRSGLPGRMLRGASAQAEMDLRAYADGARVYQLYAVCPRATAMDTQGQERTSFELAEAERRAFLGSFSVKSAGAPGR